MSFPVASPHPSSESDRQSPEWIDSRPKQMFNAKLRLLEKSPSIQGIIGRRRRRRRSSSSSLTIMRERRREECNICR